MFNKLCLPFYVFPRGWRRPDVSRPHNDVSCRLGHVQTAPVTMETDVTTSRGHMIFHITIL